MGLPECKECPENFNPRAPRGARHFANVERKIDSVFQSTRPSRGATAKAREIADRYYISIHAPLAGRDGEERGKPMVVFVFQSTRPSRGATLDVHVWNMLTGISIHAPLAGRDSCIVNEIHNNRYFNPRAPRGARHSAGQRFFLPIRFQSTRPSRGATMRVALTGVHLQHFNPRAPRGARQE